MFLWKVGIKLNTGHAANKQFYITVQTKFISSHFFAFIWTGFSIYVSRPWLNDLSVLISPYAAFLVIAGIAYIPGYLNAFLVVSLLLDKQPPWKKRSYHKTVTILIAARNEALRIKNTISYISNQDYKGKIKVLVIDNASTDDTSLKAKEAAEELGIDLDTIRENNPGKFNALNTGLRYVTTDLTITLDADTLLHKSAVRYLVSRIESAPKNICAVAGSILVRNSRQNLVARIQEWDYFLGIASIKRLQGLYQGTLVAQGAYSIYKTECLRKVGGWPDAIGEDIVLTWNMLKNGWKVYFEPMSVAFTEVPATIGALSRQRSRWARGMIEALKVSKPWHQPQIYTKYLTGVNFIMPFLDFTYTFVWLPGLVLALFGHFWIVGPTTLLVLPLTLISYAILYQYQKYVFRSLNLKIRKNLTGFLLFVLVYQIILSPVSVLGYMQEFLQTKRVWK